MKVGLPGIAGETIFMRDVSRFFALFPIEGSVAGYSMRLFVVRSSTREYKYLKASRSTPALREQGPMVSIAKIDIC